MSSKKNIFFSSSRLFETAILGPCLVSKKFQDSPSRRMFGHMYGALNADGKKQIIQFGRKPRDESFEPN
jgi:hypothetical protein